MDLSDEALIQSFRKTKDSSHFKSLVRRYQNRIYNAAYRILGNTEEAEEVVQEACIKAHQHLTRFQPQASFAAWIFKVAHNLCMDALRDRNKRGSQLVSFRAGLEADGSEEGPEVAVGQVADDSGRPEAQLDVKEESAIVQSCLEQLPETQRAVVVLHDIEGLSYQEIADIVGANLGTVRSRLHYGRLKLRQLLEPYFSSAKMSPTSR